MTNRHPKPGEHFFSWSLIIAIIIALGVMLMLKDDVQLEPTIEISPEPIQVSHE